MKTLKSIHRTVALDMALGMRLCDICELRDLNYSSWLGITQAELFKECVKEFQRDIEEKRVEEFVTDPVVQKLQREALPSVKTLVEIRDNDSEENPTSTRLRAASEILKAAGYGQHEKAVVNNNTLVINISGGKLEALQERMKTVREVMPDRVQIG